MRKCGVLMPVASLPSRFGIGGFSKEAYDFVDFLEQGGQSLWQILPLGPTGYGDSPYQSFSTFAGNPYYISLDALIDAGLLTEEECEAADYGDNPDYINYEKIYNTDKKILEIGIALGLKGAISCIFGSLLKDDCNIKDEIIDISKHIKEKLISDNHG